MIIFQWKTPARGKDFVKIVNLPEKKRGEYGKNPTNQFLMSNVELGIRSIQVSHFLRSFPQNRMFWKRKNFLKGIIFKNESTLILIFLLWVYFQRFKRGVAAAHVGGVKFIKHMLHSRDLGNSACLKVGQKPTNVLLAFLGWFWTTNCGNCAILLQSSEKIDDLF